MSKSKRSNAILGLILALLAVGGFGMARLAVLRMGRQPDGAFLVSSGQRIEGGSIAFDGRPIDLAPHPTGGFYAVLNQAAVFLGDSDGIRPGTEVKLGTNAGFRGLVWSPEGSRLFASTDKGYVQGFRLEGGKLALAARIALDPPGTRGNPVPGGMAITRD